MEGCWSGYAVLVGRAGLKGELEVHQCAVVGDGPVCVGF